MSDDEAMFEAAVALRDFPDDIQRRYLLQLVRRRCPGALAIVNAAPSGGSLYRRLVLRRAWCVLHNLPGPIVIDVTFQNGLPDFLSVEMSLTDPEWDSIVLDALPAVRPRQRSLMYLQAIMTTEVDGVQKDQVWHSLAIDSATLERGQPWRFLIATANAPKPCKVRVAMLSRLEGADDKEAHLEPDDLMPMSNEIVLPVQRR